MRIALVSAVPVCFTAPSIPSEQAHETADSLAAGRQPHRAGPHRHLDGDGGLPTALWLTQFALAALSDWLDGKLARRWGCATPGLRQADSIADTVYVLAVAVSLWFSHPDIVRAHAWGIGLVIGLELLRYPLDWWRFGRGASYHPLSAKLFGASLLLAVGVIMVFDRAGPFLWIALLMGVVSEIEGCLMSLVLREWTHDVRHLKIAFALRRARHTG